MPHTTVYPPNSLSMFLTFFIHRISFGYFDHVAHRWFGGTNESALHIQYVGLLHGLRASLFCAATLSCEHHLFPRKKVTNDLGICSFHSCDSNFKQASNSLERQAVPTTPMSSWIAWDQAFSASRFILRLNVASDFSCLATSRSAVKPRHKPVVPPKGCLHLA